MSRHQITSTGDPEHWRSRAEEARVCAEMITDPESRRQMFGVVDDYMALAERVEARLAQEARLMLEALLRKGGTK